jgi:hypothetical protein
LFGYGASTTAQGVVNTHEIPGGASCPRASDLLQGMYPARYAPQMPPLSADHVRALELLASSPAGCTDAVLTAHGFTHELITELIAARLASIEVEQMLANGHHIDVPWLRITDAGRVALSARSQ